ncbi:nickel-dependent hydrogenase large subunit [Acidianus sp. RZ1]|uniref:nickel-dependent hydrogenase large subunit n=1 Tax=Acidianus sp. RZ1 TaxID=1540082 RepID=UPI0014924FC9|nr:nickel-dependent hydrogenase large subunit [Acidianus sp. RZ1]NON63520.1 nickel-dependent hydrogenase large subunit [Acidianus sp. RZ1]
MSSNQNQIKLVVDPVTRVAGHLGLTASVNTDTRQVINDDAYTYVTMFRGFEVFLRGREPPDAVHITSRSCGVCGAAHANASVRANDMALGAVPYPLGQSLRNMAYAMTDMIYDHSIILNVLEGPDFSAQVIQQYYPTWWATAQQTKAEYTDIHGFSTIADIMTALNPFSGSLWVNAVKAQILAREAGVLIYGRHSHPPMLIPGGIGTDLSVGESLFSEYMYRLTSLTAWVKVIISSWMDLANFLIENFDYELQGLTYENPTYISSYGYESPVLYSELGESDSEIYGNYDNLSQNASEGPQSIFRPAIVRNGELLSKSFIDLNVGQLEFVNSSYYRDWAKITSPFSETDPIGNKLAWGLTAEDGTPLYMYHPWNKTTIPNPQGQNFMDKYSWDAEPRLVWKDGTIWAYETGPWARLHAVAHFHPSSPIVKNGKIHITLPAINSIPSWLPSGSMPEWTVEWDPPNHSTTLSRILGRAVDMAAAIFAAWDNLQYGLEVFMKNQTSPKTSRPWKQPSFSLGVGQYEVPRGTSRHWMVNKNYSIANYQYQAPTTANVSPRDNNCQGSWCINGQAIGPFEMSVINTKVMEEVPPSQWVGYDFLRAIRSFDPCLVCAVHFEIKGKVNRTLDHVITPVCNS